MNDLIQFIESKIKEITYQGKLFANPCRFRVQSNKCIFRRISKNKQLCNQPLCKVISPKNWYKIPKYLHWNCKEDNIFNSYIFDLKIKNKFKFNFYQLIMQNNNNIHQINYEKLHPNLKMMMKHTDEIKQECTEEYKHNDKQSGYKYDRLFPFSGLCNNDKILIQLWKKNKLFQMTDYQLCNALFNMYENYTKECGFWNSKKNFDKRRQRLEKEVDQIIKNERLVLMGQPLSKSHILSIILYCNQGMSPNLTNSQMNGNRNEMNKYIVFDYCLFWAITILNQFTLFDDEKFDDRNNKLKLILYSGAGVIFKGKKNSMIEFITHTSFSLNFETAKKFAIEGKNDQNEATILRLNCFKGIVCCDVSWMSKFDSEMEILVRRHCGTKYLGQFKTDEYNLVCLGQ